MELITSPLTTLGSSISTPDSFYTARGSGSPSNPADETGLSSLAEEQPPDGPGYRDAVPLPHELKWQCQIHLEERLYTAAIHILSGLLSDGTTTITVTKHHQQQKPKPARIPPPSQLALLATLPIHPSFTSRPPETANVHAASHALSYLRSLLRTVGALNANFRAAFDFHPSSSSSSSSSGSGSGSLHYSRPRRTGGGVSGAGSRSRGGTPLSGDEAASLSSDSDALGGPFASSQLVFSRAQDFWSVLGWAFRCAAEQQQQAQQHTTSPYAVRWRYWRVWLELVIGVLEADWDERLARDQQESDKDGYPLLSGSLLVGYLGGLRRDRKNVVREVLRAVFAFCDAENLASDRAVYREVFEKETVVGQPGKKSKRKRAEEAVVDLENDRFGDYLGEDEFASDEEDGEGEDLPVPKGRRKPGRKPRAEGASSSSFTLTDDIAETVPFRLRIFRLLSAASYYLPETFTPVDELYERFTDTVRGLPLPMFRLFVASHPSVLPESVQVSFLRMVIEEMLPRHPDPADVDPECESRHGVSVLMMEKCFLPFAANRVTADDNAKLSLALESLMWFVYSQIDIEYSEGLRRAVETGIKAREEKTKKRTAGAADKAAREMLARSARNLSALVDVVSVVGR